MSAAFRPYAYHRTINFSALPARLRNVLRTVASLTWNDRPTVEVSIRTLALAVGTSMRNLRRMLGQLSDGGWLLIRHRAGRASLITATEPAPVQADLPGASQPRTPVDAPPAPTPDTPAQPYRDRPKPEESKEPTRVREAVAVVDLKPPASAPMEKRAPLCPEVKAVRQAFKAAGHPVGINQARELYEQVAARHARPVAYIERRIVEMARRRLRAPLMLKFIAEDAKRDGAKEARTTAALEVGRNVFVAEPKYSKAIPIATPKQPGPVWVSALARLAAMVSPARLRLFAACELVGDELRCACPAAASLVERDVDLASLAAGRTLRFVLV